MHSSRNNLNSLENATSMSSSARASQNDMILNNMEGNQAMAKEFIQQIDKNTLGKILEHFKDAVGD